MGILIKFAQKKVSAKIVHFHSLILVHQFNEISLYISLVSLSIHPGLSQG